MKAVGFDSVDLVTIIEKRKIGISARSSIHERPQPRKTRSSHIHDASRARLLQFLAFAGFRMRIVKREVKRFF